MAIGSFNFFCVLILSILSFSVLQTCIFLCPMSTHPSVYQTPPIPLDGFSSSSPSGQPYLPLSPPLRLFVNDTTQPRASSATPFSRPTLVTKLPIPLPSRRSHLLFLNSFNLLTPLSTLTLPQYSSTSLPFKSNYSTLHTLQSAGSKVSPSDPYPSLQIHGSFPAALAMQFSFYCRIGLLVHEEERLIPISLIVPSSLFLEWPFLTGAISKTPTEGPFLPFRQYSLTIVVSASYHSSLCMFPSEHFSVQLCLLVFLSHYEMKPYMRFY